MYEDRVKPRLHYIRVSKPTLEYGFHKRHECENWLERQGERGLETTIWEHS